MKTGTSKRLTAEQRAELKSLAARPDEAIDTSDAPELLDWSGADRGLFYRPVKQQLTLRLDADVVAWFKSHTRTDEGYQTRINRALREYVQRQPRRSLGEGSIGYEPEGKRDQPVLTDADGLKHYTLKAEAGKYAMIGGDLETRLGHVAGWVYLHDGTPKFGNALSQILDEASDRVVGIIAGAFIEEHLTDAIKRRLQVDNDIVPRVFQGEGFLASFGAKISLGWLLGLYSAEAHKELVLISKIRNAFAHRLEVNSFKDAPAKDHCSKLVLWESKPVRMETSPEKPFSVKVGMTIGGEMHVRQDEVIFMPPPKPSDEPLSNRQRFTNACKFYLAALTMFVQSAERPPTPSF